MKRTISIASLALSATTSMAFVGPNIADGLNKRTYCLDVYTDEDGTVTLGTCDESANNADLERALNSQGCAEGQAAMHVVKFSSAAHFSPTIKPCMAPNVTQM